MLTNSHPTEAVTTGLPQRALQAAGAKKQNRQANLAVAPLSALDLPPAQYIHAAHTAGFTALGLRIEQVTPTDPPFPRSKHSAEFREIQQALHETGMEVVDVEVLTIRQGTGPDQWLPLFELGAELGAQFINVSAELPSLSEFEDSVGRLTQDAQGYGIRPVLEPVAFRPLNSFEAAVNISRRTGSAVVLDVLHFMRTHAQLTTIAADPDLFPLLQLCDAPPEVPTPANAKGGQQADANPLENMIAEARAARLVPGDPAGTAPIRKLLEILGPATRISVEIPNAQLRAGRPAADYLSMLFKSVSKFLNSEGKK